MEWEGKSLQGILAVIGLLVLIFDSGLAIEGARSGVDLCLKTVIPSLFPFFVLSMIITNSLKKSDLQLIKFAAKLFQVPVSATSVFLPCVLGGYPIGAKCVGELYREKQISRNEAERMLSFCNNAGPSFLFGMVSAFFPDRKLVWILWLVHLSSAALTALVIPQKFVEPNRKRIFEQSQENRIILPAIKAMSLVCCWIILFRIIITFLKKWFIWILPLWVQVLFIGFLELTNGCCELMLITDIRQRFVVCSCMLAFGGICVLFQTKSVTAGLSVKYYILGKMIQTVFSFLLCCAFVTEYGMFYAGLISIFFILFRKIQNRYGNLQTIPV